MAVMVGLLQSGLAALLFVALMWLVVRGRDLAAGLRASSVTILLALFLVAAGFVAGGLFTHFPLITPGFR